MLELLDLLVGFWNSLVSLLDNVQIFGVVSFWDILIGFLILGFIASVFWKGART